MKTVHVVEFGYNLTSDQLADNLAEELKAKLEKKGLTCYTRPVEDGPEGEQEK
jgi:hypothetical protein